MAFKTSRNYISGRRPSLEAFGMNGSKNAILHRTGHSRSANRRGINDNEWFRPRPWCPPSNLHKSEEITSY